MARFTKAEKAEALETLRGILKPGDRVVTILRHVSTSGMSRSIDLYIFRANADGSVSKRFLSRYAAIIGAGGCTWDEARSCCKITGCGQDMGFAIVYDLSWSVFDGRPAADAPENDRTTGDDKPRYGYWLAQEWL